MANTHSDEDVLFASPDVIVTDRRILFGTRSYAKPGRAEGGAPEEGAVFQHEAPVGMHMRCHGWAECSLRG